MWNQRSVDLALGLPFNMASYCILLYMVASITGYKPHRLIGSLGDVHIYVNHINGLGEQLHRIPYESPKILINPNVKNIDDFKFADIEVIDYVAHPAIKMDIAV
jgi:thymidylate synthase